MPLLSQEPERCELPDLRLVGACTFADFFDGQWSLLGDTWQRFLGGVDRIENRVHPDRTFGLELYPPGFPKKDGRWYYFACAEVQSLEHGFPTGMVCRFLPAAVYARFLVQGPITEVAPAFRFIYDEWIPNSGVRIAAAYDLEVYGPKFVGPDSDDSIVELLLPVLD